MKLILDPCCGSRMFWFDRSNPNVVFGDQRRETVTVTDRSHGREDGTRTLNIEPDFLMDFRALKTGFSEKRVEFEFLMYTVVSD